MVQTPRTLEELRAKIRLKLEMAREDGARLDAVSVYESFLGDLNGIEEGAGPRDRTYTTDVVADRLGLQDPETIARYCREGRFDPREGEDFPAPYQLDGRKSPWRIPSPALAAYIGRRREADRRAVNVLDKFDTFLKAG